MRRLTLFDSRTLEFNIGSREWGTNVSALKKNNIFRSFNLSMHKYQQYTYWGDNFCNLVNSRLLCTRFINNISGRKPDDNSLYDPTFMIYVESIFTKQKNRLRNLRHATLKRAYNRSYRLNVSCRNL